MFKRCGIEIKLDTKKFRLKIPIKPKARKKKDLRSDSLRKMYTKIKDPVYLMYRDVSSLDPEFKKLAKKYGIRYDLTLIREPPYLPSCLRTLGHYHPEKYAELYEVIYGKALFILQSKDLKKMGYIIADGGEEVLIPPNFGHQTMNRGKTPLLLGNLVCSGFKSDYSVYKKNQGAAFGFFKCAYGPLRIFYNMKYGIPFEKYPKIKKMKSKKTKLTLDKMFEKNPKKVADFLRGKSKSI